MMSRNTLSEDFMKGIVRENPIFMTLLGLCPAIAVSDKVSSALGMGAAVAIVLIATNLTVSILKEFIQGKVRTIAHVAIIATFSTVVNLLMHAYLPALYAALGLYAQLIAVNCIIIDRANSFAQENSAGRSVVDAIGMGIGFTLALTLIALVREVLGHGTITLFPAAGWNGTVVVPGLGTAPIKVLGLSAGAFLVFGYLKAMFNAYRMRTTSGERADMKSGQTA